MGCPKSYREVDGCHNCARVFVLRDYDQASYYYCKFRAQRRPQCGSVLMNESYTRAKSDRAFETAMRRWERWSKNREVQPYGMCDHFRKSKP